MNTTTNIAIANLHPFEDHPYQVRDDAELDALVESIREHGILTPLDRKSTRLNSSHPTTSRMPSSA